MTNGSSSERIKDRLGRKNKKTKEMGDAGALRLVMTRVSLRANVAKEWGVRTGHTVFLSPFLDTVSEDDNAQVVNTWHILNT